MAATTAATTRIPPTTYLFADSHDSEGASPPLRMGNGDEVRASALASWMGADEEEPASAGFAAGAGTGALGGSDNTGLLAAADDACDPDSEITVADEFFLG
jgi:hypothetical protein